MAKRRRGASVPAPIRPSLFLDGSQSRVVKTVNAGDRVRLTVEGIVRRKSEDASGRMDAHIELSKITPVRGKR